MGLHSKFGAGHMLDFFFTTKKPAAAGSFQGCAKVRQPESLLP